MRSRFRWPSPASAIAVAALFFALGGGAVAAGGHYLITSTKQIKPSVLKQLKGAKGSQGSQGLQGQQGQQGPTGDTGPRGQQGTTGDTGLQGQQGPTGVTGPAGATGQAGPLVTIEAWHEVGAGGEPAFQGSWTNQDSNGSSTAAFYKDPFEIVHLKGYLSGTSLNPENVIFILPEGYRPAKQACFPSLDQSYYPAARVIPICVGSNGHVSEWTNYNTTTILATLDGITFRAGTG